MMPRARRAVLLVLLLATVWSFARSAADSIGEDELPVGSIAMWSGVLAEIPQGWVLCDGSNGTPDLRARFVRGAAQGEEPGATGGSAAHGHPGLPHAHTIAPWAHTHTMSVNGQSGFQASPLHTHEPLSSFAGTIVSALFNPFDCCDAFASISHTHSQVSAGGQHNHAVAGSAMTSSFTSPLTMTQTTGIVPNAPSLAPPFYTLAFIMRVGA